MKLTRSREKLEECSWMLRSCCSGMWRNVADGHRGG